MAKYVRKSQPKGEVIEARRVDRKTVIEGHGAAMPGDWLVDLEERQQPMKDQIFRLNFQPIDREAWVLWDLGKIT